ncbi:MAG TPA: DNA mismatch repair protein MutS [Bacilli bacterium]|jgi:DNA mismatch repair protein MutS|nr:DNA mismatch repair protein MutS [Bacilli bacterium]HQC83614.1 DNA mismatch repair protein MutS [Bacilli bacterium]
MKRDEVNRSELSPMMLQYLEIKDKYPDTLLFYRIGDFYELFFEDADVASRELELTLTGKNAGLKERVPMCGVPHHAAKVYVEKLIDKGFKVAICEQLEDPRFAKGMVKRDVTEVITKGTMVDLEFLNERDFNYIGGLLDYNYIYLLTYLDISTGEVNSVYLSHNEDTLINELLNLNIKELVIKNDFPIETLNTIKNQYGINISISDNVLEDTYASIYEGIEDERITYGIKHILYYLHIGELKDLSHLNHVNIIESDNYLSMDVHTVRNLELVETLRLKERKYSLIWLLDKTKTAMGARTLKNYLLNPLKDINEINKRYDYIESLNNNFMLRDELRNDLYNVYDLERLCGKVSCGSLNARDVLQIKNSISVIPDINRILSELKYNIKIDNHEDLYKLLESAIYEDPPITIKEGYLIKDGYNKELDELKSIRSGGKDFIASIEESAKKETGINNLHVGYNKVFGYFIEVTKGQVDKIPEGIGWERRQTLTGAERFISPELKEKEALILNAEERIIDLEYDLFCNIRAILKDNVFKLQETARTLAFLDVIASLSIVSEEQHLVRPTLVNERDIEIIDGSHPVVEVVSGNQYIKNDIIMPEGVNTLLITGPNMSGKSTYMRQLAITVIMAQMGSFVPAASARLPIFDKIFTRIGASDDLVSGESTFMVEMLEARNALVNATSNSLVLFDELGRGTATYDGMSLARAILEYITTKTQCKTLFSTHYHELTDLDKKFKTIKNIHVEAKEENGEITFLHKVKDGSVDKSYGIHVARLAGLPEEVLTTAQNILNLYETKSKKNSKEVVEQIAFDLTPKETNELDDYIKTIDPLNITPMEAMNILFKIKELEKNKK